MQTTRNVLNEPSITETKSRDYITLDSCLIYTWAIPAHPYNNMSIAWVGSFIEPDLFDNNVRFRVALLGKSTMCYVIFQDWMPMSCINFLGVIAVACLDVNFRI